MSQENYLSEIEAQLELTPVKPGTRFLNYLIDVLVLYFLLFIFGMVYISLNPSGFDELSESDLNLISYGFGIPFFVLYYTLLEGATKGKTIGKYITRTKVARLDGNPLTWRDAFLRSLSRLVPFEPLTGFSGNPWHDKWTDTTVVKN